MAGTVTVEYDAINMPDRPIRKLIFTWTSSAAGAADGATTQKISGTIVGVNTIPGSGGNAPTDNYDIVITDEQGVDVLGAQGMNRDTANKESVCPGQSFLDGTTTSIAPRVCDDVLTLAVTNAGNAKSGTIVIYLR